MIGKQVFYFRHVFIVLLLIIGNRASAQKRRDFFLPDIPGYVTLKADFHMHTPFSDGSVWPTDRVMEAWRDGLDVIALTDHVEYNPNKQDVSTDLNRPYAIARPVAERHNILLVKAAEITRKMPPGHFNALFLDDPNLLKKDDLNEAFAAAAAQGAFFIWNHPGWKVQQPDSTHWFPIHDEFLKKGWLHGIEVFNDTEFYPIVHRWAFDRNLTMFANSDAHGPIDFGYDPEEGARRPFTLVFARERSIPAVREALFARRTAVVFNDTLIGQESLLLPLIERCLKFAVTQTKKEDATEVFAILSNTSDLPMELSGISNDDFSLPSNLSVSARSSVVVRIGLREGKMQQKDISVRFKVMNVLTGPDKPLEIPFKVAYSR